MNILVMEDQDDKFELISSEIQRSFPEVNKKIVRASNFGIATKNIYELQYDLIVIDLMMPMRDGEDAEDISEDIISVLELSDFNRTTNLVALSGFGDLVESQRKRFTEAGIILVRYDGAAETWKKHISAALLRMRDQIVFDFVIVCALEKERAAYRYTSAGVGELRNVRGLDCMPIDIAGLKGVCVKAPRMGLVEASIVTTKAIDMFRPRLVTMSGICAGDGKNAKLGTLVVADMCWEYQAGKWADDGFKIEHYDVPIDPKFRTTISQYLAKDEKVEVLKSGLLEDPVRFEIATLAPMSTGSAVVASKDRMEAIGAQHRKMAGLDMEMYGVYKAAEQSSHKVQYFGAKTVVDLADAAKGDKYHEYGTILSARFIVTMIGLWAGEHRSTLQ